MKQSDQSFFLFVILMAWLDLRHGSMLVDIFLFLMAMANLMRWMIIEDKKLHKKPDSATTATS